MRHKNLLVLLAFLVPVFGFASWLIAGDRVDSTLHPRISGSKQLTFDGLGKTTLGTDGTNLYFTELVGEKFIIAKVPAVGGDVSKFDVHLDNAELLDVSSKHSSLLAADFSSASSSGYPFWVYSLSGGAAQRLVNVTGHEAVWSPDVSTYYW